MDDKITMIEIFSGIGAQEKALSQLPINGEVVATMDVDKDAILSYAAMRYDFKKELNNYNFPTKEQMVSELQKKNVGFDFKNGKHTITNSTNIDKVKQYYLADKLSKNLGDVSLCEKLPHVDIAFHSSPCQDFSLAGKGAGGDEGSGTRSSLMFESLRLIGTSKPKYVIWENVSAVLSPKHRHNFIKMLEKLSDMGYESTFNLLNSKHYGVPQNRLRIFCISRLIENDTKNESKVIYKSTNKQVNDTIKEIVKHPNIKIWDSFIWPEEIPLTIRLKDVLEKNVPEKYYLPDDKIEKILDSSFIQNKKCLAIKEATKKGYAEASEGDSINLEQPNSKTRRGRVGHQVAQTLTTSCNQGVVEVDIKVIGNYSKSQHDASRVVDIDGVAPCVKENHGTVTAIAEPQVRKVGQASNEGSQSGTVYSTDDLAPTLIAGCHGYAMGYIAEEQEPFIVASRDRNPENPSDRTAGSPTVQRLEPNFSGCTNTPTSVQKDNYIVEPIIYDDYNSRIPQDQDVITTLTTNCGAAALRNGVKIVEPMVCEERRDEGLRFFKDDCVGTLRTIDACGDKRVLEPEVNQIANVMPGKNRDNPNQGRVYDTEGLAPILTKMDGGNRQPMVVDYIKWRIRKLMPVECWKLMAFSKTDCIRASKWASNSALYKQAGNSIVVSVLTAIFSSLLLEDGYKADVWTRYTGNINE